jgi:uncharacterized membrane protein YfcA
MNIPQMTTLLTAAGAAGWVDAVVGGGGLILIPAVLLAFPGISPATALGTNKLAAISGTTTAAVTYLRRTRIDLVIAGTAGGLALVFAGLGALSAAHVPTAWFRPVIMAMLLAVALFVAFKPAFGAVQGGTAPTMRRRIAAAVLAGCVIGFYDGCFGPGTGTFLILTFTSLLFLEFVQSSATAKVVNAGTNLGALLIFATGGHVLWGIGLGMAVCNTVGARLGAMTALRRGTGFVRAALVALVTVMVVKLGYDQFH